MMMSAPSSTSSGPPAALPRAAGILLVGGPVAELGAALGRVAERPVEAEAYFRRVRADADVSEAARVERGPDGTTWPSIMPLGATMCTPARACARATRHTAPASHHCPRAARCQDPAVTVVGVLVRHRSAISTVSWPTSATRSRRARWTMPAGSSAAEPRASLTPDAEQDQAPTPASTASAAAFRALSLECCTTPGIDARLGSSEPSLTNSGSTRSAGRMAGLSDQPSHRRGVRSRRGLATEIRHSSRLLCLLRLCRTALFFAAPPSRAALFCRTAQR